MKKITCIVVDDEPLALEQIKKFIGKVSFLELKAAFDNGFDTLNYIKINSIDLIFLDIEMDEFSGLDLLESLENPPYIILTTAYDKYALKGYELQITDYLLKPISYQRFIKATNRVFDQINNNTHHNEIKQEFTNESAERDFIFVKTEYKMQRIAFKDILYIKSEGNYLSFFTVSKEKIYILSNFKNLLKILPNERFVRIHKSIVVAIDKIESIGKNHVEIGKEQFPIGESYKQLFFNFLENKSFL